MLTAVVLSHNDEKSIGKTLASLTFCNEIIVIDDTSTDSTKEIARKYSAPVFTRSVAGDFAAQRNFALTKARGDWIIFVDSDEVVSPELAREIQHVTSDKRHETVDGYYLKRMDILWGREFKYGETAHVRLLRLAKKGAGTWIRSVHEVWQITGKTAELTHPLIHLPHPNVAQFLDDINMYSTINAEHLFTQGCRARWYHIVAYPIAKFIRNYLWLQGFRDGIAGIVVALMMSFHSFLTRAKLYVLWQKR